MVGLTGEAYKSYSASQFVTRHSFGRAPHDWTLRREFHTVSTVAFHCSVAKVCLFDKFGNLQRATIVAVALLPILNVGAYPLVPSMADYGLALDRLCRVRGFATVTKPGLP